MTPQIEFRSFTEKLETRAVDKPGFLKRGLKGYAVVYGSESRDMGGWREVIVRGAFTDALADNPDILLLYQHDMRQVMARQSAGTLALREDNKGVYFEADLTDTAQNRDVLLNVDKRNLNAMSFGMPYGSVTARWEARSSTRKYELRHVTKAGMVEVSVVTQPAYEDTSVAARDYQTFLADSQNPSASIELLRARFRLAQQRHR